MKIYNFVPLLTLLFFNNLLFSQISDRIYGQPDDFKEMKNRTLVVELLEEDEKHVAKLTKKSQRKEKFAVQLKKYQDFIVEYNEMIQLVVPKYWSFNDKIEYKTSSEVKKIREAENKEYVLLFYTELRESSTDTRVDRATLHVPALAYSRPERAKHRYDYKIYLPSSYIREGSNYFESDFKFALKAAQANINWIIDNNEKLNFEDFCKEMAEKNCSKLSDYQLIVDREYLYGNLTETKAGDAYGNNLKFVSEDELDKIVLEETEGKAVLFSIPFGTVGSTFGPLTVSQLAFIKVIVDVETYEVLYIHIPGMGKSYVYEILKNEFTRFAECKM